MTAPPQCTCRDNTACDCGAADVPERTRECPTCRGVGRIAMPGPVPPTDAMGLRLFTLFAERDITQAALAELIGRTQPTISQWLAGDRRPNYGDLCKLADLFDTTTDYLIGRLPHRAPPAREELFADG